MDLGEYPVLSELEYLHLVFQRRPAPHRRIHHQLPLGFAQRIKKDGAVSPILLCVVIARRCALVAPGGVFMSGAVPVPRLAAAFLLRLRLFPFIRRLPVAQGLIVDAQALRKFPEVYQFAPAFPGEVFSLCGVPFLTPLRHLLSPLSIRYPFASASL